MSTTLFHFSFAVNDLDRARKFYGELLQCPEGRKLKGRVDYNFFGHHIVAHLAPDEVVGDQGRKIGGALATPLRHFGVVMTLEDFQKTAARMEQLGADMDQQAQRHAKRHGARADADDGRRRLRQRNRVQGIVRNHRCLRGARKRNRDGVILPATSSSLRGYTGLSCAMYKVALALPCVAASACIDYSAVMFASLTIFDHLASSSRIRAASSAGLLATGA